MIRFKEYLERRARRAAFMSVCLAGLAVFGGLSLASCANEDLGKDNDKNGGDKGAAVSFNVSEAQNEAQEAAAKAIPGVPVTRAAFSEQLGMMNLTPADLTTQKLDIKGTAGTDLCLIETTTPGVNPMRQDNHTMTARTAATTGKEDTDATTRANITTMTTLGHFSSIGYRGTTATGISNTPWFHDKDTNPDGTLVSPIYWSWQVPFGKFFAIAPREASSYARLKLSPDTHAGTPYVDFEVEPDVKNQKDLMTACSGVVQYATQFVPPTTNLKFRHALTAVRFKVGQNLSYSKTITKVEIIGAMGKGRYTLSADETGTGAAWSNLSAPQTFTLGGDGTVNVSTTAAVNQIILGNNGDNFTFYMIPQSLSGVSVKIHFSDGSTPITANLSGTWKPGTTKTYALSQKNSSWSYQFTVYSPAAVDYDKTTIGYYIESYRQDLSSSTREAVKWKVVGYQESADGGATFGPETTTRPVWLTALTAEGNGSAWGGENGNATITKDFIDKLEPYIKVLREATPKTGPGGYYDLSMHDHKGNPTAKRNTANSYLISAPGHYKIPLVYGNAITNGKDNKHAYISQAQITPGEEKKILWNFKDHAGQNITNPWITQTNGGANAPDNAKIVWADQSGLVDSTTLGISADGQFVQFHVPQDKIRTGNAVIAVRKGNTVVWSWHLWFDHKDVLDTIACTNYQNKVYKFTKQPLGFIIFKWDGTPYDKPRVVKVKVEQEAGQASGKKYGYVTITQKPFSIQHFAYTLYQFGRKDAMPSVKAVSEGSFTENGGNNMSIQNGIQHPETFYTSGSSWQFNYSWRNLWSMDSSVDFSNDNPVVKTIYDPCPVGFKMPASNAFTGFTTNGENGGPVNYSGIQNGSWIFNNKISNPDATILFMDLACRRWYDGMFDEFPNYYYYWSAGSHGLSGYCLMFSSWGVDPLSIMGIPCGIAVRPVFDE